MFKNWQSSFSRKIHFCPNCGKKGLKWLQNKVFWILWKISLVFPGNNLKWKLIVIDILPPIPYMAKFWFLSFGPKYCWLIKLQDYLKCNISREKWMIKFIFGMQINMKVFYKLTVLLCLCSQACPKYPQQQV